MQGVALSHDQNRNGQEKNMSCLKKNKKCPCRLWVNCPVYVDEYEKERRLKSKDLDIEIRAWYRDNFKIIPVMPDIYANG